MREGHRESVPGDTHHAPCHRLQGLTASEENQEAIEHYHLLTMPPSVFSCCSRGNHASPCLFSLYFLLYLPTCVLSSWVSLMGRGIIRTQEGWWKHVDDEITGILPRRRPGTVKREAFMSVVICPIRPQSGIGEIW